MNAKKLPSGNWRVRVFDYKDDKKHYKSFTAFTKSQAEYLAAQYKISHSPVCGLTFETAMKQYINERENVLSPASIRKYKSMSKSDYLTDIKPLKLEKISTTHIQEMVNGISGAPKTVRSYYGFVISVLKRFDINCNFKVSLPKKKRPDRYLPSDNDVKKLFKASKGTFMELPIYLAAVGCLRRGEIASFSKSDLEGNKLHISKTMVLNEANQWVVKAPKSYKGDRYVPLPPFLVKMIKNMPHDTLNLTPNKISSGFEHILNKAGIEKFRFHDLRHYGASVLSKLGVNTYTIMSICGWENEKMLNEIYRYQFNDEIENASKLTTQYFKSMTRI